MSDPPIAADGRLGLFGASAWYSGAQRRDVPDSLPGYLLVYLAYRNDWVAREALAGLFWPERAEEEAQHNLRANLHRVRGLLGSWDAAASLQAERRRVRLALPSDVGAFREALGAAEWARAAALHAEPLLATLSFRGFPLLEEWARAERQALAEAWRDATLKAAQQHEHQGDHRAAADALLRLARSDTVSEDAIQALLRVARDAGRRDEALAEFERFRQWLQRELGMQPMQATLALAESLRVGRRPAVPPRPQAHAAAAVPRAVIQPPRLIGRERELQAVADPAHRIVAVGGEPGVGKTRLLEEALPTARWITCREGLQQVPFAPVIEYLRDVSNSLPELGEYRRDLARLLPELAPQERVPPADPAAGKARLLEALARVLEDGKRPLVFDDVQWADAATAELIVYLAQRAGVPIRVAHRDSENSAVLAQLLAALESGGGLFRLKLAPLSRDAVRALLALLSRAEAGPPLFSAWLHTRTGGNPFFALQVLRALFESGRLRAYADGWASDLDAVTLDYSELEVPPRVAEVVRRRLSGLSEAARRVLAAVAVVGAAGDVERLAATVGLSVWATAEALAEAESAGLLRDGRFAHDLVRESHLAQLSAPVRRTVHAAVARHFAETLAPAQSAMHWWAAEQVPPALAALGRAVADASASGLQSAALEMLHDAAARLERLAPQDTGAQAYVHALTARMHLERAELDTALRHAEAAIEGAASPADRASAWRTVAAVAMQRGQLQRAQRALREARHADPEADELLIDEGKLAQLQGRIADMITLLEARVEQLRRRPPAPALVNALTSLGGAYDEVGDAGRGVPLHQEAYRLAKRLKARYAQVDVAVNLAWGLSSLGRDEEAVAIAREALALGEYDGSAVLRNNLAYSLRRLGRFDEARAECERLLACHDTTLSLLARARLIDLYARLGDARRCAEAAAAVVAALDTTEVPLAHYAAAINLARHGTAEQLGAALARIKPIALDPWTRDEFVAALSARGIEAAPYLGAPPAGV